MRQKIDCLAVRLCAAIFFMFVGFSAFAQKTVTGTVTSAKDNLPVNGASVLVKGTNVGAATSPTGIFSINVPAGKKILVISSVGYDDVEVDVSAQTTVTIALKEKTSSLDEIVVTGYTAQKKKSVTGAVSVVSVKNLKSTVSGSAEQMLQGQAAGVTVTSSGQPGAPNSVRVRGITSFGNSAPLVIIDGVSGSLTDINPNDIESFQILKDASASIYGVRGSNGVIVITTKRGKGKVNVSYDGYYGTQIAPKGNPFNLLDVQGEANVIWLAQKNSNLDHGVDTGFVPNHPQYGSGPTPVIPDYLLIGSLTGVNREPTQAELDAYNVDYSKGGINQIVKANQAGTDWFHEVFQNAPMQSHNISASGSNDKSSYFLSMGYFDQKGILLNSYLKRYTVRANTVFNVKDHIRVGENLYMVYKDNPTIPNNTENTIASLFKIQPIVPVYDINGGWAGGRAGGVGNEGNPVFYRTQSADDKGRNWNISGNIFAEVDFLSHFTARTSFGGNLNNYYYYYYTFHRYHDAENNTSNGLTEGAGYGRSWTWTNTITYSNTFGKHSVNVLGGLEAIDNYGRSLQGGALGYFTDNPNFRTLSAGSSGFTNSSGAGGNSLYSQFGQVNYGYNDKYLLGATVRRDGSSKFGELARYGVFPAVTVGWVISRESFMKNVSFVNNLKLRGSWGKLGNDLNVDPNNAFNLYGSAPGESFYDINGTSTSSVQGFRATRYGNPATGWEEDVVTNVGFDATLFKNKLDVSFEWYTKSINGLLFDASAGALVGGGSLPKVNIGDIENKGFDLSATYHASIGKDLKIDIGGTLTSYKSNITKLNGANAFDGGFLRIQPLTRNQIGHPISAFYGYQITGLWQSYEEVDAADAEAQKASGNADAIYQDAAAPGRFRYADINGDNKITVDDRTFLGDPNPDFTYGINLGASYKGFDFYMFLYGSKGNEIVNYTKYFTDFFPSFQGIKSQNLLNNSWTWEDKTGTTPIAETGSNFSNNGVPNSYYIENGSFLRCKSLIIGYTLPSSILKKLKVDKFRIYVQAANLFTITKYSGLDPEVSGSVDGNTGLPTNTAFGIDQGNYPSVKSFLVGVNLNF